MYKDNAFLRWCVLKNLINSLEKVDASQYATSFIRGKYAANVPIWASYSHDEWIICCLSLCYRLEGREHGSKAWYSVLKHVFGVIVFLVNISDIYTQICYFRVKSVLFDHELAVWRTTVQYRVNKNVWYIHKVFFKILDQNWTSIIFKSN